MSWLNLFDNALKFTPDGGNVSVMLKKVNDMAIFELHNSGQGIEADALAHIFDKFYQADASHATAGNGLGLTLAKKIVQLHGGNIVCTSRSGEGTVFTVSLALKVFRYDGGNIKNIRNLKPVQLNELSDLYAMNGNNRLQISENVQVLLNKSGDYRPTTLSAINTVDYYVTGWYDDFGYAAGGRIRFIVATEK